MRSIRILLAVIGLSIGLVGGKLSLCTAADPPAADAKDKSAKIVPVRLTEAEWRQKLTKEQFEVTRLKGTEAPFTGKYWNSKDAGVYHCVCCDLELFKSATKFDSGTGWPSFYQPLDQEHVKMLRDTSHGMERVEVLCARCDAHLGHVFDDGPAPTGLRYCMNSVSLTFTDDKGNKK